MKLPTLSLDVAAHRSLSSSLSRPVWPLRRSIRHLHSAEATRQAADGPQRPQPHPRQRQLPHKPWQFRDLEASIRQTPSASAPPPDIGVDYDTALEPAIMNLKITKPDQAPLVDYRWSSMPPKIAELCHKLGLSLPHTKRAWHEPRLALEFSISKKHCFHDYHVRDIVDSLSPFQNWALDFHVARHEQEPLWLNLVELGGKKVSPIVKTRGVKRTRHAFAEALRRNGYDRRGRPLGEKEAREAGTEPAPKRLYGTVRVRIFDLKKICGVPYAEVVDFWERHIAERIGNQLGGRSAEMLVPESKKGIQHRKTATGGSSLPGQRGPSGQGRNPDRRLQRRRERDGGSTPG